MTLISTSTGYSEYFLPYGAGKVAECDYDPSSDGEMAPSRVEAGEFSLKQAILKAMESLTLEEVAPGDRERILSILPGSSDPNEDAFIAWSIIRDVRDAMLDYTKMDRLDLSQSLTEKDKKPAVDDGYISRLAGNETAFDIGTDVNQGAVHRAANEGRTFRDKRVPSKAEIFVGNARLLFQGIMDACPQQRLLPLGDARVYGGSQKDIRGLPDEAIAELPLYLDSVDEMDRPVEMINQVIQLLQLIRLPEERRDDRDSMA